MTPIEARIRELRRELRGLPFGQRRRVLDEARDHLLSAIEDGKSDDEAAARLGEPRLAFASFPGRRRRHRAALITVPLAFLVLATPVSSTLEHLGAGAPPSQAATSPIMHEQLQRGRCVAAWNAASNDRWRRLAHSSQARIAEVSVGYASEVAALPNGKRPPLHLYGCAVFLRLARAASPYQPWLAVFARYTGGAFHFDRTRRGHSRTAKPASNARVSSIGDLTLTSQKLFQPCPSGPVGTRIQSVEALSPRQRLMLGSTTRLSLKRRSFAVEVRNTGRVVIHGAIANLAIYPVTSPDAPIWASKPVTVRSLAPGATVTVRFTPRALGNGKRYVRATSAAVECETRFSDNSPVFRIDS